MASNLLAMASGLLAMASSLLAMASSLLAYQRLLWMASHLLVMASNLRATASNLIYKTNVLLCVFHPVNYIHSALHSLFSSNTFALFSFLMRLHAHFALDWLATAIRLLACPIRPAGWQLGWLLFVAPFFL